MISRYRVSGTFENLNEAYSRELAIKQSKIDKLNKQLSGLKTMIKKYKDFIGIHGLVEVFEEFIKPKGIREKLEVSKRAVAENSRKKKAIEIETTKKHDIAI